MAGEKWKELRDEVEKKIEKFNYKQLALFAWLCATRALPFLSDKRGFVYWDENDRQNHLFAIFNAVNVACGGAVELALFKFDFTAVAVDVRAASADANDAAASNVAYSARDAADVVFTRAAFIAAYAAVNAIDAAGYAGQPEHIQKQIYTDIENISNNIYPPYDRNMAIYRETWYYFLEDLRKIGCSFWADYYQKLFANGFVVDEAEFERILSVPEEIQAQGAAAVGQYLENLGEEIECLNEARIIILGEKGAGKTSLARKLVDINAKMPDKEESTEGVITSKWSFPDKEGDKNITAHIWDFAGHSITHAAHRCFMSARCLYIYVYNGRIERDNDPEYWLEQIRLHGDNSPILFLVNKTDKHEADIAINTLKSEYPSIVDDYYADIGNEDTSELEAFVNIVMEQVRNNPAWSNQIISKEAYQIKAALHEHFKTKNSPHITRDEFDNIASKYDVEAERADQILKDLHTLGICLWYNDTQMGDEIPLVLNPDWIADGIYRIINMGHKEKRYVATVDYGVEKLKDHKHYSYSRDNVAYLFKLMRKYELAYFKEADNIFIPGILSKDKPDSLPKLNDDESLTMVFEVRKALPPNIVCRVIVNRCEDIRDETLLWRRGAILQPENMDATALIVEDGRGVVVDVVGKDRTAYLSELRTTIKTIFEDYKGANPELKYKILLPEEVEQAQYGHFQRDIPPQFETEGKITAHARGGIPLVNEATGLQIPPNAMITVYAIKHNHAPINHTNVQYNFYNNAAKLQGELITLAEELHEGNFVASAEKVEKLTESINAVLSTTTEEKALSELTKQGGVSRIRKLYENLADKNSLLYKSIVATATGLKAIETLHKIGGTLAQNIPELIEFIPPEIMNSISSVSNLF